MSALYASEKKNLNETTTMSAATKSATVMLVVKGKDGRMTILPS